MSLDMIKCLPCDQLSRIFQEYQAAHLRPSVRYLARPPAPPTPCMSVPR